MTMDTEIYNIEGKVSGKVSLPEEIFGLRWNADLVKQVVDSIMSSRRKPIAHVKERGEVRGGGKKPWRQKGTGRARHGSSRSPIWVGGGVTHGPRNDKNFERKVTKKAKAKALHTILSKKYEDGEILFIDSLTLSLPKTKEAKKSLSALSKIKGFENILSKKRNSAVFALDSKDKEVERSFKNFGNVEVMETRNIDPVTLLKYKYLVIENPEESFKVLPGSYRISKEEEKPLKKTAKAKAK